MRHAPAWLPLGSGMTLYAPVELSCCPCFCCRRRDALDAQLSAMGFEASGEAIVVPFRVRGEGAYGLLFPARPRVELAVTGTCSEKRHGLVHMQS